MMTTDLPMRADLDGGHHAGGRASVDDDVVCGVVGQGPLSHDGGKQCAEDGIAHTKGHLENGFDHTDTEECAASVRLRV